jgi:hypothetical protein
MEKKNSISIGYEPIAEILIKYDPIGVYTEGNKDEYDSEAKIIIGRVNEGLSINEIRDIVHSEFIESFDENIAGEPDKYIAIAEDIYNLFHAPNKLSRESDHPSI